MLTQATLINNEIIFFDKEEVVVVYRCRIKGPNFNDLVIALRSGEEFTVNSTELRRLLNIEIPN